MSSPPACADQRGPVPPKPLPVPVPTPPRPVPPLPPRVVRRLLVEAVGRAWLESAKTTLSPGLTPLVTATSVSPTAATATVWLVTALLARIWTVPEVLEALRATALIGTKVAPDKVAVVIVTVAGAPANRLSADGSVEVMVTA